MGALGKIGLQGVRQGKWYYQGRWIVSELVPASIGSERSFLFQEKVLQTSTSPAHALKLANKSSSYVAQLLFKLLSPCWVSEQVRLCEPFKNRALVSYSPPALPELRPTDFQSQMLWRLIFLVWIFRARSTQCGAWTHCPSQMTSIPIIFLPLVDCYDRAFVPNQDASLPSLPFSTGLFLHIFAYGRDFLQSPSHSQKKLL